MTEEERIYTSKIKFFGIFTFSDYYRFCYGWLMDETKIEDFEETKYTEKMVGDSKEIEVEWNCQKKLTDYFKEKIKIKMVIKRIKQVKIKKNGAEINTNEAEVEMKVEGSLLKDYQGKFEMTGFRKFLRSVYEKYIIPSTVEAFRAKVATECDEFLSQAKAFLDLEGKK